MPAVGQKNGLINVLRAKAHGRFGSFCGGGKAAILSEADFDDLMPFRANPFEKSCFVLFALALDQIKVSIGNGRACALAERYGKLELA